MLLETMGERQSKEHTWMLKNEFVPGYRLEGEVRNRYAELDSSLSYSLSDN